MIAVSSSRAGLTQAVGRAILRAGYRVRVFGTEHVPAEGPVLLAANHLGWLDGPALLFASRQRPLRVLAKHELWRGPFAPLLRSGGAVPIDWRNPDRTALLQARTALRRGEAVGIFPEGTRCRGDFAWLRDGISYLLTHEPVPVVPVAIFGTRPTGQDREHIARPGSELHLVIGPALPPASVEGPPSVRRTSREIGLRLRELLADHVASAATRHGLSLPDDDVSRREDRER